MTPGEKEIPMLESHRESPRTPDVCDFIASLNRELTRLHVGDNASADVMRWLRRQNIFIAYTREGAHYVKHHESNRAFELSLHSLMDLLGDHARIWFVEQPTVWSNSADLLCGLSYTIELASRRCVDANAANGISLSGSSGTEESYLGILVPAMRSPSMTVLADNPEQRPLFSVDPQQKQILRILCEKKGWVKRSEICSKVFSHLPENRQIESVKTRLSELRRKLKPQGLQIGTSRTGPSHRLEVL